jgi:hypothetical protein
MRELVGQGQRLLDTGLGVRRVPQQPERDCGIEAAVDPQIDANA